MPLSFSGPDSFYSAGEEAWWSAVDKALKGAAREKLTSRTDDGLAIAPLYQNRTDVPARALRPQRGDWIISQRIDLSDAEAANAQILEDLNGGASGLDLVVDGLGTASGRGIRINTAEDFATLYKDVQPDLIETRFDAGEKSLQVLSLFLDYLKAQGSDPSGVKVTVSNDPNAGQSGAADDGAIQEISEKCSKVGSPARFLGADGQVWHNLGASQAQELALVLASAVAQLRSLEKTELAPETWNDRISLILVADADQFGTIAKARALRKLWASVLAGSGLPQSPANIHMTTSQRMLTRRDPWVNLLRNTVASFAAGVGGADGVCVLPHTFAVGVPDAFARRLARNTQSMLLEESSLAKVMDPAAGSGAIEARTEQLCSAAWAFFQEIEAAGGLAAARESGLVDQRIAETKAKLEKDIAKRKRPVTGVSEFPNLGEEPVAVLAAADDADAGWRYAEPFEALRNAADAHEKATGAAPAIFLASLGKLAQFTARATWTANAFAAGGLKATDPAVFGSIDEVTAAFKDSGAALACIVSSDAVYEAEAEAAAKALTAAGAKHLYLAGKPGDQEAAYRAAGVGTFVYAGCDILELLREAHGLLGLEGATAANDLEDRA